jgi:hypothetical protein
MTQSPAVPIEQSRRKLPRREYLISAAAVIVLVVIWLSRYWIGGKAVEIVDPVIRRWAAAQVSDLSDGAYQLTISPMQVDAAARRVAIDTIVLITDPAANGKRAAPLPAMTMRFRNCSFDGLDLDRLAAGEGIHATRAGCDSVSVSAEVPKGVARDTSGAAFLTLRQNLDLPESVPFIRIDTLAFPQVAVAVGITGASGQRTALAFDRLAMRLDSLHYERNQAPGSSRTLFSRDVTLLVEGFEGSQEFANRLAVGHLGADLTTGTAEVYGFEWEPVASYADSLGLAALAVDTLRMTGIDWATFFANGDVHLQRIELKGGRLRLPPEDNRPVKTPLLPRPARTLEARLRTLSRVISVDTLDTEMLQIAKAVSGRDSLITTVKRLNVSGVNVTLDSAQWASNAPLGPVKISVTGLLRRSGDTRLAVGSLQADFTTGTLTADSLRSGHDGTIASFLRGRRQRKDRIDAQATKLVVSGADAAAFVRSGTYRLKSAALSGFVLDVYSDKNLVPGPPSQRRTPQQWVKSTGLDLDIASVSIAGRVVYRERGVDRDSLGELRFDQLRATLTNVTTNPRQQSDAKPLLLSTTSRLMGVGDFRVDLRIPLLANNFRMTWTGSLGPMPASALNPLLVGIAPITFKEGRILGIRFEAATTEGLSTGVVVPRWDSLFVETPGVARTGALSGIRQALAKFAANQFMIREANRPGDRRPPEDGTLSHQWVPRENLIQHLWFTLRDGLLPMIKR